MSQHRRADIESFAAFGVGLVTLPVEILPPFATIRDEEGNIVPTQVMTAPGPAIARRVLGGWR